VTDTLTADEAIRAQERAGFIAGLRELADRLERHPDAPLPYHGSDCGLIVMPMSADELAAAARCYGGDKVQGSKGLELHARIGGVRVQVVSSLAKVCERVEVGTKKTVVYDIPDEVREQYAVEVEEPVFEVRCPESVLRPGEAEAVAS
jgi:hypothetical protein